MGRANRFIKLEDALLKIEATPSNKILMFGSYLYEIENLDKAVCMFITQRTYNKILPDTFHIIHDNKYYDDTTYQMEYDMVLNMMRYGHGGIEIK